MAGPWERYATPPAADGPWSRYKQAEPETFEDHALDIAKGAGSGVVRGTAIGLGMGGDLNKAAGSGIDFLERKGLGAEVEKGRDILSTLPWMNKNEEPQQKFGSQEIMAAVDKAADAPVTSFQPQTRGGRVAQTIGEFVPAALATRGGFMMGAAIPGATSEVAGQLTEGTKAEPYARVAGALASPFVASRLGRAVTPFPTNQTRQAAVQTLEGEGVDTLTAGQRTGSKGLQYLEDARGGDISRNMMERQGEQFTAAVLRRAGENAERATPEVVDRAFARIGNQFDQVAARNTAQTDPQFFTGLRTAVDDYNNLVSAPNRTPAVDNFLTEISNAVVGNGGQLPGRVYQSLRSRMERTARGMGNNPEARNAIRDMREVLDDAMERSIAASGNAADIGAWREARAQYRNILAVEGAAAAAGEKAASGILTPQQMRAQVVRTQGKRNYARGQGDFSDLVRAGNEVMLPLPNSGTAQRNLAQNIGMGIPAILGGYGGSQAGGAEGAAIGALAGLFAPRVAGRLMMSRPGQAYLSNQVLAAPQAGRPIDPVVRALMGYQHPQQRLEGPR